MPVGLSIDTPAAHRLPARLVARVLLPLRLEQEYSYLVPQAMRSVIRIGMRVVVQFGAKRICYGVVSALEHSEHAPAGKGRLKPLLHLPDGDPVIDPAEFDLWRWASAYYSAPIGLILPAVLPSFYLPDSQTTLTAVRPLQSQEADRNPALRTVMTRVEEAKGKHCKLQLILKLLGVKALKEVEELIRLGALSAGETINTDARTVGAPYIRFAAPYKTDANQEELLLSMGRAKAQKALLQDLQLLLLHPELQENADSSPAEPQGVDVQRKAVPEQMLTRGNINRKNTLRLLLQNGFLERIYLTAAPAPTASSPANLPPYTPLLPGKPYLAVLKTPPEQLQMISRHALGVAQRGGNVLLLFPVVHPQSFAEQVILAIGQAHPSVRVYTTHTADRERMRIRTELIGGATGLVVAGTRAAAWLPVTHFNLIIICDEEDFNYKQPEPTPRFHARDLLLYASRRYNIPLILSTLTPSAEVSALLRVNRYALLPEAAHSSTQEPQVRAANPSPTLREGSLQVIDLASERQRGKLSGDNLLSISLREALRSNASAGRNALVIANRRGYAPQIRCKACGEAVQCPNCAVSLTYYKGSRTLRCAYCGYTQPPPSVCPTCSAPNPVSFGFGEERIEEELRSAGFASETFLLDLNALHQKKEALKARELRAADGVHVVVMTRMAAYLQPLPRVGLIAVTHLEQLTSGSDFRAQESAFAFLYRLTLSYPGVPLIVQSYKPEHPMLKLLVQGRFGRFVAEELELRAALNFPPFCRMINLYVRHAQEYRAEELATALQRELIALQETYRRGQLTVSGEEAVRLGDGFEVLGPITPYVSRVRLKYIRYLCIKVAINAPWKGVRALLALAQRNVRARYNFAAGADIYCDVDPK